MLDSLIAGMVVAGRYRLERQFASGACGSLWHAHDEQAQLTCTVRLADAGVVDLKAVRARFQREVEAANALRCENVVNVLDHGEWSGMPFIVFESLNGEDLATRLQREGRLPANQVLELVSDVAHALSRAHELGLVHRDLKPENIFLIRVGAGEVAKVLDFGIAGGGDGASLHRATKLGPHLGQPLYTSPEQATAGQIDFRSDLWSLAAIAFHCLAGRPPFVSSALDDLLTQIASGPVPRLAELAPDLPEAVDAWRENALSRDPELRFQSAEELADALAHAFQRATLPGHPSPEWRTREARRAASSNRPASPTPEDLDWLSSVPDASARAADNFSDAPMSRQRAYWGPGSGVRRRALRVSVGAVFGLLTIMLAVALVQRGPAADSVAEAPLPSKASARPVSATRAAAGEAKPEGNAEPAPAIEPAGALPLVPDAGLAAAALAPELATPGADTAAPCQATPASEPSPPRVTARPRRTKPPNQVTAPSAPRKTVATASNEPDYGI